MKKTTLILQFRISLKYSNPAIWRTIQIDINSTFDDLHNAIQAAFYWENEHLYQFELLTADKQRICIAPKNDFWDFSDKDNTEQKTKKLLLKDIQSEFMDRANELGLDLPNRFSWLLEEDVTLPVQTYINVGDTFSYVYDMGDNWEHEILCEALLIKPARVKIPRCIDGAMNHAFEDVGGIGGYYYTLEALKDPKNPVYKEQVEWMIECFGRKILKYDMYAFDATKLKF